MAYLENSFLVFRAAWIWGGDAIYGDEIQWRIGGIAGSSIPFEIPFPKPRWLPATPEKLRHLYTRQKAHPGYKRLLERRIPILGTWDDHDYGRRAEKPSSNPKS